MLRVNYDEYVKDLKKKSLRIYTAWAASESGHKSSGRPKSWEEDAVLFLLDRLRWEKNLAAGSIEKTGPRRYRIK